MLDAFEIVTTSGVVLWSKSYAPIKATAINSFMRDVFIEERAERTSHPSYKKDGYTFKWTTAKDLGLIFVVCFDADMFACLCAQELADDRHPRLFTKVYYTYPT